MSTTATASDPQKSFVETVVNEAIGCSVIAGAHSVVAYALFPAVSITTAAVYGATAAAASAMIASVIPASDSSFIDLILTVTRFALPIFAGAAVTTALGYPITFSTAAALTGTILISLLITLIVCPCILAIIN